MSDTVRDSFIAGLTDLINVADETSASLYEQDPENNGVEAQRWADASLLLEQALLVLDSDPYSGVEDDFTEVPLDRRADESTAPSVGQDDPWRDRI